MRRYLHIVGAAALALILAGSAAFISSEPAAAAAKKLKVSPASKVLYLGKTVTLKSNVKVRWSITKSDAKKIKLSSKKKRSVKVKALNVGTAYVKAKYGKKIKKVKITVRRDAPTSVTLKTTRDVICRHENCRVSLKSIKPSNASREVTYASSDKSIASVSKTGLVTGNSPGKVTISAKSKVDGKVKGRITIYVAALTSGTVTANFDMTDPDKYPAGKIARIWVPIPSDDEAQKITRVTCDAPYASTEETTDSAGNKALYIEWGSETAPENRTAVVSFHVRRQEIVRRDNLASLEKGEVDTEKYADYLKETQHSGSLTSGIVKETADQIVSDAGAVTLYDKVYAIYDWVVEHLSRDASTPGLGKGDVPYILTHLDSRIGKCTDVNSVFDALCRAEGIPARGIFGMKFDTCGQKCKPQFFLPGYGWADCDPSEVLKQIKDNEDAYRGENAPLAEEWARLKAKYWAHADAGWFMFSEGRDITLSPAQSATAADEDSFLNDDGTLNYFVFPFAEYDGQYCMSHNKKLFPYTYRFEEDAD